MMKKLLSIILALTLCLGLCLPALADSFDPTLTIEKTDSTITVTMNATPDNRKATLTIDCGGWYGAEVFDHDHDDAEVESTYANGKVSFLTSGGTYLIKRVDDPNPPAASGAASTTNTALPQVAEVTETEKAEIIEELTDVSADDWYADAVAWAVGAELMTGYGDGVFAPADDLSRGMLVQILYNLEQQPETAGESFADVSAADWCADAVAWAKEAGVTKGEGDGTFGADEAITRQELVVMLYRYARKIGLDISVGENANLLGYKDAADLADWAYAAMQWACGAGIIHGRTDGTLDPWGTATRAEVAIVFQRLTALMK